MQVILIKEVRLLEIALVFIIRNSSNIVLRPLVTVGVSLQRII